MQELTAQIFREQSTVGIEPKVISDCAVSFVISILVVCMALSFYYHQRLNLC